MYITKKFTFEASHIVRNCSSDRCKYSVHGHSFTVEIRLTADKLDRAGMIFDFGLLKLSIGRLIDAFDHSTILWNVDDTEYIDSMKLFSDRWIVLPVSPSAEQLARLFVGLTAQCLRNTKMENDEGVVTVHSVTVHETAKGSATATPDDLKADTYGFIDFAKVDFSAAIRNDWPSAAFYESIINDAIVIANPEVDLQVEV